MSVVVKGLYPLPKDIEGKKIALLGGSFNPAHSGHIAVTKAVINEINPDYLIWLVTPHNPLKNLVPEDITERIEYCHHISKEQDIIISDCEKYLENAYTAHTIQHFIKEYPNNQFYWVMGADNMLNIHLWHNWHEIFKNTCVVVVERDKSFNKILESKAAMVYNVVSTEQAKKYCYKEKWCFLNVSTPEISSSKIREAIEG